MFKRLQNKQLVVNMVDAQPTDGAYSDSPKASPGEKIYVAREVTKYVVGGIAVVKTVNFSFRMAEHFIAHKFPIA